MSWFRTLPAFEWNDRLHLRDLPTLRAPGITNLFLPSLRAHRDLRGQNPNSHCEQRVTLYHHFGEGDPRAALDVWVYQKQGRVCLPPAPLVNAAHMISEQSNCAPRLAYPAATRREIYTVGATCTDEPSGMGTAPMSARRTLSQKSVDPRFEPSYHPD